MKTRIENVMERGKVDEDYINNDEELQAFTKFWTAGFTRPNHPSIIQVLLESGKDKDMTGHGMSNLIYVSREKNKSSPHHFKAGALNALLRVSGIMTNAPIILTLDCDMYSNDPSTPQRALCYFLDQTLWPELAFVQFPQCFHGLNEADIYASEIKDLFHTNSMGMDGLRG
ncbi:cellulose synthase-like protein G3, partial [Capsicum annuum]|uniref:cellulose synthase-like protein G3 n=1 Tax=Capsicum annuum TaxID=4072 RepID=UPI001FB0C729